MPQFYVDFKVYAFINFRQNNEDEFSAVNASFKIKFRAIIGRDKGILTVDQAFEESLNVFQDDSSRDYRGCTEKLGRETVWACFV